MDDNNFFDLLFLWHENNINDDLFLKNITLDNAYLFFNDAYLKTYYSNIIKDTKYKNVFYNTNYKLNLFDLFLMLTEKIETNSYIPPKALIFYNKLKEICENADYKIKIKSFLFHDFYLSMDDLTEFDRISKLKKIPKNYVLSNNLCKYLLMDFLFNEELFLKILDTETFNNNENNNDLQKLQYIFNLDYFHKHYLSERLNQKMQAIPYIQNQEFNFLYKLEFNFFQFNNETITLNEQKIYKDLISKNQIDNINDFKKKLNLLIFLEKQKNRSNDLDKLNDNFSKFNVNYKKDNIKDFLIFFKNDFYDSAEEIKSIYSKQLKKILEIIDDEKDFNLIFDINHPFFVNNKSTIITSYLEKGFTKLIVNNNLKLNEKQKIIFEKNILDITLLSSQNNKPTIKI